MYYLNSQIDQKKTEEMLKKLEQQERMFDSEFTGHDTQSTAGHK